MLLADIICDYRRFTLCAAVLKQYSVVNVGFTTTDGREDETQLDVASDLLTPGGLKELLDLFTSLCAELFTAPDRIEYVNVIATADSQEEIEELETGKPVRCSKPFNVKEFAKLFSEEYDFLYDRYDDVLGFDTAVDEFDSFHLSRNSKAVDEFARYREDAVTSDREAAAFSRAFDKLYGKAALG
jgi:hypothetical protein